MFVKMDIRFPENDDWVSYGIGTKNNCCLLYIFTNQIKSQMETSAEMFFLLSCLPKWLIDFFIFYFNETSISLNTICDLYRLWDEDDQRKMKEKHCVFCEVNQCGCGHWLEKQLCCKS